MSDHIHHHQHASHHHTHAIDDDLSSLDAEIAQARLELGTLLRRRFLESKETSYINEAVEMHRQSLRIFEDHPHHKARPSFLSQYGFALRDRFHHTHSVNDITDALSQHETALTLVEDGNEDEYDILINISETLCCRFDAKMEKSDLDRAILLYRRAVALKPMDHFPHGILADCLEKRANMAYDDGDAQVNRDVNELLEVRERQLKLASSAESNPENLQNKIATSFYKLFMKTRLIHLLDRAISIFREARTLPGLPPSYKPQILINLSACLHTRYNELKKPDDLKEAVELSYCCYKIPDPLPTYLRVFIIITLCKMLRTQYDELGDKSKLTEEIVLIHQFLGSDEGTAVSNSDRGSVLVALGTALRDRFMDSGRTNIQDIEDSVKFLQEAQAIASTDADRMLTTNSLVGTLILQHHAQGLPGDPDVMQKAIELQEKVVDEMSQGDPNRGTVLRTLASAWEEQYLTTHTLGHLDKSIEYQREAISLSKQKYTYLPNLVYSLYRRYVVTERIEDLDEAITICKKSISLIEEPHPNLCIAHSYLGRLLTEKFINTKEMVNLRAATDAFRMAALNNIAPTTQRFFAAQRWAKVADEHKHETVMEAYTLAIQFLPRLAVLGLDLPARRQMLTVGSDGLAREAATCAMRSGNFERAIEFLEEGRAVFWSQALQLRTSFDELKESAAPGPALAERLQDISTRLEQLSRGTAKEETGESLHKEQFVTEKQAAELQSLDKQWQACVEEVRLLPGFDRFLLPKLYSDLRAVSSHGPVVILNIVQAQGEANALILKAPSEKIIHVPLPEFKLDVMDLGQFWGTIRGSAEYASRSRGDVSRTIGTDLILRPVLRALWVTVVKPVIRALELKVSIIVQTYAIL